MIMAQTEIEKLVTQLEERYKYILQSLSEIKIEIGKKPDEATIKTMISKSVSDHIVACLNQKKNKTSYPPPRSFWSGIDDKTKARLLNTLILVLASAGTILAAKTGVI